MSEGFGYPPRIPLRVLGTFDKSNFSLRSAFEGIEYPVDQFLDILQKYFQESFPLNIQGQPLWNTSEEHKIK